MNQLTPDWPLILASRSPRRIALLTEMNLPFRIHPSDVEEPTSGNCDDVALLAARLKAEEIAREYPNQIVLGADTLVCLGEQILGKPSNPNEARRMLSAIRNRWHVVVSGICLVVSPDPRIWSELERTRVKMADFSDREMDEYIATGEPMDKAGGYAIQGDAARFVEGIEGDYFNVVGLPVGLVLKGLSSFVDITDARIPEPPLRFR